MWQASDHFAMLPLYLEGNNSVWQPFYMDKTTLINAQLVATGLKRVFYHLKSVDCER